MIRIFLKKVLKHLCVGPAILFIEKNDGFGMRKYNTNPASISFFVLPDRRKLLGPSIGFESRPIDPNPPQRK